MRYLAAMIGIWSCMVNVHMVHCGHTCRHMRNVNTNGYALWEVPLSLSRAESQTWLRVSVEEIAPFGSRSANYMCYTASATSLAQTAQDSKRDFWSAAERRKHAERRTSGMTDHVAGGAGQFQKIEIDLLRRCRALSNCCKTRSWQL